MKRIILSFVIFTISLYFYRNIITSNKLFFHTDEAYWISTAKIFPLLLQQNYQDSFWKEYYGFVNFNGAKLLYGIGFWLFGTTNVSITGVAPQTYYRWVPYDGKPFPTSHSFYPLIKNARYISAIFTSASVALVALWVYFIFDNLFVSFGAALLVLFHPIIMFVATHALADSFFLFFEMLFLTIITLLVQLRDEEYKRYRWVFSIGIGFTLAWLTSIKLNGALFLLIAIFFLLLPRKQSILSSRKQAIPFLKVLCVSMVLFFLLLQPNFYFYTQYSPLQMIQDRIRITQQHITYFSHESPEHVILPITNRLNSSLRSLLPLWLLPLFIGGILHTLCIVRIKKLWNTTYGHLMVIGSITWIFVLSYVVFDEPRYWIPLLPFIILVSLSWMRKFAKPSNTRRLLNPGVRYLRT